MISIMFIISYAYPFIYYPPYVHMIRMDTFTNMNWERLLNLIYSKLGPRQTRSIVPRRRSLVLRSWISPSTLHLCMEGRYPPMLFLPHLLLLFTREVEDVILGVIGEINDLPWQAFSMVQFPNRN